MKKIRIIEKRRKKCLDLIMSIAIFLCFSSLFPVSAKSIYMREVERPLTKNETKPLSIAQKGIIINGTIFDEKGETIIGASVVEKGTTNGTVTNLDGKFSLTVDQNAILQISSLGFIAQEVSIKNQTYILVIMQEDSKALEEVVVVGYGTARRSSLSGAISTVDTKVFESRPVPNAVSALQGQVPGLTITRNSGASGSTATIRIRDISSLNGGSPLVLIDGAEGDLNIINPADIETTTVLKDGAAAIYGARAADGVILVTTKSGLKNRPLKMSFDSYYSIKTPALMKKTVNLYQYASMGLEITDGSWVPEYTAEDLPLIAEGSDLVVPNGIWGAYPKLYKSQNWRDLIVGNGHLQNYNLNLSGGGQQYSYMISLGFQNEKGLLKFGNDKEKRYFIRAKSDVQIAKGLDYELNISYEATDRLVSSGISQEGFNVWELMYKARSWQPMYNPAGEFYIFQGYSNPAQVAQEHGNTTKVTGNFTFNNSLTWEIFKGFNIIGRAIVRKKDGDDNEESKLIYERDWDNNIVRT